MKRSVWPWAGVLGVAVLAGSAPAQGVTGAVPVGLGGHSTAPGPAHVSPSPGASCPTPLPAPSGPPPTGTEVRLTPAAPAAAGAEAGAGTEQGAGGGRSEFEGFAGGFQSSGFGGSLTSAGTGLGTAMMGGGTTPFTFTINVSQTTSQTPLILPGLFTSARSEPAHPFDRVFFDYGYADRFRSVTPTGLASGFNLNTWDVGLEKTFLGGRASAYVRVPFLYAADNTTGQPIDGVGDISAGLKFALLVNRQTGSVLSAGMTVSAPTGRDDVVTTTTTIKGMQGPNTTSAPAGFTVTPPGFTVNPFTLPPTTTTTTVNPTILQPWVAGLLAFDRLYVQDYIGVVIPTDDRVATFLNNDLSVGYQLYRSQGGFLTSLTPTFDVQLLLPVTHRGTPQNNVTQQAQIDVTGNKQTNFTGNTLTLNNDLVQQLTSQLPAARSPSFGFPDQVFLTEGLQFGLGERSVLSVGVVEPVSGPKAFSIGAVASFNFFF